MARKFIGNTTGTTAGSNWQAGWPKAGYKFVYDFSVLGGTVGTLVLTQIDGPLPDKFIIQNALLDVITPLDSGGAATASLGTGQSAGDLQAAIVVAGAPWSAIGLKATSILIGTVASLIKTNAARSPALVIALANITAGKFSLFIEGFVSD